MASGALQHTLAGPARLEGVGVHSGLRVSLTMRPAAADSGVVFVRADVTDCDNRVQARPEAVARTQLNTEIVNAAGVAVSTIEHLMAALAALAVDNVEIELDGAEVPIMDGSALPFVQAIDRAGRRVQSAPRRYIEMLGTVEVTEGDKRASLSPFDEHAGALAMAFEIAFPSRAIGRQRIALEVTEASFRKQLAAARTFGFMHEVEQLRTLGLARGGSMRNAIVVDGDRVLNPEGLRFPDEFVRHKTLDALGDLYVLGAPVLGRFEAHLGGHAINNRLVRALQGRPEAWRVRTFSAEMARAG